MKSLSMWRRRRSLKPLTSLATEDRAMRVDVGLGISSARRLSKTLPCMFCGSWA